MNDLIMRTIDYLEKENAEQLSKAPLEKPTAKDTLFIGTAFFMSKFTRILEDEIMKEKLSGGHLYVDFQTLSRFLRKVERYREIAELGNAVTVYGAGDDKISEDAFFTPVRLKRDDGLLNSWFIVYSNGRKYYALVAVEKRLRVRDIQGRTRKFRGFWTTKKSIVGYLIDYLERVVNVQYRVEGGAE